MDLENFEAFEAMEVVQRSPEWKAERLCRITGTRVHQLMAGIGESKTARLSKAKLMGKMLAEYLQPNLVFKEISTESMRRGNELEPAAVAYYEMMNSVEVYGDDSFIVSKINEVMASSPDGLVDIDGGVEIKCLDIGNHIAVILMQEIEEKYLDQCLWNMIIIERPWWDYVGFAPELPPPLNFFQKRIHRHEHEERIALMIETALDFIEEFEELLIKYELTFEDEQNEQ